MDNDKKLIEAADKIGDTTYNPSDYNSSSFAEKGMAITHEQASDDYMEGTNDGRIDKNGDKTNIEISRTGYGFTSPGEKQQK